ncbi:MAG: ferredoxin [Acidimicrobiia bacterium]
MDRPGCLHRQRDLRRVSGGRFKFDGEYAYVRDGDRVLKDRGAMVMVPHGREDVVLDAAEECPAACIHIEGA